MPGIATIAFPYRRYSGAIDGCWLNYRCGGSVGVARWGFRAHQLPVSPPAALLGGTWKRVQRL